MPGLEGDLVVLVGAIGLALLVAGSFVGEPPGLQTLGNELATDLDSRRSRLLIGSMMSLIGWSALMWPIAAIVVSDGSDTWPSLGLLALALAIGGHGFAAFAAVATIAAAWRRPTEGDIAVRRLLLDAAHLAIWSASAPIAAGIVITTTAVGVQGDQLGVVPVLFAGVKVVTTVIEVAGIGVRRGWNAGGHAAGTSG